MSTAVTYAKIKQRAVAGGDLTAADLEPVELPFCPRCGLIGKNPGGKAFATSCVGPFGNNHRRTRMRLAWFVPEEAE